MPEPKKLIVGRKDEINLFHSFTMNRGTKFILNIFGPGGIGKSEICNKLIGECKKGSLIYAFLQADTPNLTFDKVLYIIKEAFSQGGQLFEKFEKNLSEYLIIKDVLERGGGISNLFDALGNLMPDAFLKTITGIGKLASDELRNKFRDRYALQQYMLGAEEWLTESLADGLRRMVNQTNKPSLILIDTFERMSSLDQWFCSSLVRKVPEGIKIVILGRDRIQDIGFHWKEYSQQIISYEVQELDQNTVFSFYEYHRLRDRELLNLTYEFTGGYPLCMALAVDLASKVGWQQIAGFSRQADRYEVARHLLDRLLEQEEVKGVREFLEKGVIALWFDVQAIAYLLDIPTSKAEEIYYKISRFSFIQRNEYGLKFHDKVRDLLLERLKYMSRNEYEELLLKWRDYYKTKVNQQWREV